MGTTTSSGSAYGGNFGYQAGTPLTHTLTTETQAGFPVYHRKLGNPSPLGLYSFASTTLILSLFNAQARHINTPNVVVGMTLGVGGLVQLLAGMWEFAVGNTFGATVFSSYGGFWMSFGLIYWPSSGILAAYSTPETASQLNDALGIYLITWFVVTVLVLLATFRSSIALVTTVFFLAITFLLLAIGEFTTQIAITKAGGYIGCITAMLAFYVGSAGLYSADASYFILPVGDLSKRD